MFTYYLIRLKYSLFFFRCKTMSRLWQRLFQNPSESVVRSEVKSLRTYAYKCIEKQQIEDARKALCSAIELTHFSLHKWKLSNRAKHKRMRENLADLRQLMHLDTFEVKPVKMSMPKTFGNIDEDRLNAICENKLFTKFSHCLVIPDPSNTSWDQIVGNEEAKEIILNALEYPIMFEGMVDTAATGVLLYGPPGTGKSMIARAVAHRLNMVFLELQVKDIMSKYQGESEQNVAEFFQFAESIKPCVVFIDEIDSLLGKRSTSTDAPEAKRGVTNQLLHATQGSRGLFLIGATNTPWQLDSAFIRRFDYKCYIELPSLKERKALLTNFLANRSHSLLKIDLHHFAMELEGYSGSEICTFLKKVEYRHQRKLDEGNYFAENPNGEWYLCHKYHPLAVQTTFRILKSQRKRVLLPNVCVIDFDITEVQKSSTKNDLSKYDEFYTQFG